MAELERSTLTKSILEQNCETQVNRLLNTDKEVQIDVKRAIQDLQDLRLISISESDDRVLVVKDMMSSTDTVKELWMDLLENDRKFGDIITSGSDLKGETITTEPNVGILDMIEEIDAAAANVKKLRLEDWKEKRRVLTTVLEEKKDESIAKAKAAYEIKKDEGIAKAKAAYEVKKDKSIAKAKAAYEVKKDESIAKARAALEEGKDVGIAKAKAVLEEGNFVRIAKARKFLRDKRNSRFREYGDDS